MAAVEDILEPDEYERAVIAAGKADAEGKRVSRVGYLPSQDRVTLRYRNGITISIPRHLLEGLAGASPDALKKIEILGGGEAIYWPLLDVGFPVQKLAAGILGTRAWMSQLAGRTRSEAKAEAARMNGRKGGRPPRNTVAGEKEPALI